VQQVILNLVLNARDAMPDGGRVRVATWNCQEECRVTRGDEVLSLTPCVRLAVTDTGCGMDAETRSHLFEPFFTTKRPGRGNGLGLATVHSIVTQYGGAIEVDSEPGKGTCVSILLPRAEEEIQEARNADEVAPARGGETVLLVEDDSAVRRSVSRVLSECGYKVLEAASGAEALKICQSLQGEIDLLLADRVMPGLSGREVARQLRVLRPGLRVLYMSGFHQDSPADGEEEGPVVLFRKPFTGSALARKVREILDESPGPRSKGRRGERP
jgi:CheY-like chemotaxis protein